MPHRIAGIDVHKKMLAVAVADVEVEGDVHFERLKVGTSPVQLRALAEWLVEREVEEVVMESTAQYWRPVWEALERYWRPTRRTRPGANPVSGTLHLAQAQSNRGAGGRKRDFPDAERLVKRLVAQELTLSFVPDAEQRLWRTVMRRKYQITRSRVQLHNRLEALLEEAHIKISSVVSDLLGPARVACCTRSATVKRIRRRWPHWPISDCGPRPSNCATPSGRARICIRVSAAGEADAR
jgi:transposase